jgi:hypothetical protein
VEPLRERRSMGMAGGILISNHQTRRCSIVHRAVERDMEADALAKGLDEAKRRNVLRGTWFHTPPHFIMRRIGSRGMSWPELERLVADAEANQNLRQTLCHCRSPLNLVLAARRQGYRITRINLQNAWLEDHQIPKAAV